LQLRVDVWEVVVPFRALEAAGGDSALDTACGGNRLGRRLGIGASSSLGINLVFLVFWIGVFSKQSKIQ
jgi:hypothetical protein